MAAARVRKIEVWGSMRTVSVGGIIASDCLTGT